MHCRICFRLRLPKTRSCLRACSHVRAPRGVLLSYCPDSTCPLLVAFGLTREDWFPGDVCQHFIVFIAGERPEGYKRPKSLSYVLYKLRSVPVGTVRELRSLPYLRHSTSACMFYNRLRFLKRREWGRLRIRCPDKEPLDPLCHSKALRITDDSSTKKRLSISYENATTEPVRKLKIRRE